VSALRLKDLGPFAIATATVVGLTAAFRWLGITNHTTVALSFLLVVLVLATVSSRRVAIATSIVTFLCFNYFFLPPVGTWTISDPENWVALFTLLAVGVVASHLSAEVRRRAAEAVQLLEERKEAEVVRRNAELKSALLASLGHDLRTPLTAAAVAANNLQTPSLSDEQRREQADIVRAELERLNRLFQNIIEMARIDTNAVAAEREWVQPSEIIEAAARRADCDLAGRPLEVEDRGEQMLVRIDPRLTSAALAHVLENAAQYSPAGTPITVTADAAPGRLRLSVRDRGAGIDPSEADRIFDRFYRGAGARHQRAGTGMGLAIASGLLAAQGGRIRATTHREGGAVFELDVPAESRPAAAVESEIA
jgi:two-component system, OmpR family, sensor histidine kinase KdpD